MRFFVRFVPALVAIMLVGACSIFPKPEPQETYRLPVTPLPRADAPPVNWSLRVDTPQGGRMIDSARIVVLPQGDVVTVYRGARWSDPATTLLRNRLIDAFHDDGRVAAVSSDDSSVQADYILTGDMRAFQTEYQGDHPVVVIRFDARLISNAGLRIIATHRFEVTQPVSGSAVPQVVTAFGQASDALAAQLVSWTLQQPARNRQASN